MTGCQGKAEGPSQGQRIVLAGNPNVGKSVLFNRLSQGYAEVSNYPGTTVMVNTAPMGADSLVDAPGTYSLTGPEVEARTAREIIGQADLVVNVIEATCLERDLFLTLQLCEAGLPLVVALNMWDEVQAEGLKIDVAGLARELGVEVVPTVAVSGEGLVELKAALTRARPGKARLASPEEGLTEIPEEEPEALAEARALRVQELAAGVISRSAEGKAGMFRLEALLIRPRTGVPIALGVVGLAFFLIGKLVAQDLVGLTEGRLMGEYYAPAVRELLAGFLAQDSVPYKLLAGEFGVLTMTVTYLVGLLLPLIMAFYLLMALLEDSGYLPRLAILGDRAMRKVGLNGRAVIPMILGIGCVTMATMTTRLLSTARERNIAIALLALSVPCSAQLGVILGLLAGLGLQYWLAYLFTILLIFAIVGALLDKLLPGAPSPLLMELPRLRRPRAKPVLYKTTLRSWAFLKEATPLFAIGALALGVLEVSGGLTALQGALKPLTVGWLGLPPEAATAFIMGFVRRDFGAAGLYGLGLAPAQGLVALVVITLFVPCVASVMMIAKEKGAAGMALVWSFCLVTAFLVGGLLAALIEAGGWLGARTAWGLALLLAGFGLLGLMVRGRLGRPARRPG